MCVVKVRHKNGYLNLVELAQKAKNMCKYLQSGTYFRFEKYLKYFRMFLFFFLNTAKPSAATRCIQTMQTVPCG